MGNTENLIRLTALTVHLHESQSLQLSERHWGTREAGVPGHPARSAMLAAEPKLGMMHNSNRSDSINR